MSYLVRSKRGIKRKSSAIIPLGYSKKAKMRLQKIFQTSGELKGVDTVLTQTTVIDTTTTNASVNVLNLVVPGSSSFNRVGRKIHMKYLKINGVANYTYSIEGTTSNIVDSVLRMVIVYDNQPSGVQPTFDTIFGYTPQSGTEASSIYAPRKFDNMKRFKVLLDKRIKANPDLQPATGGSQNLVKESYPIDTYLKLNNLETIYSGQTDPQTIADISSGALYIYWRANNSSVNVSDWTVPSTTTCRLRYTD